MTAPRAAGPIFVSPRAAAGTGLVARLRRRLDWWIDRNGQRLASAGAPPGRLGWRWTRHAPAAERAVRIERIHPPERARNPLPRNLPERDALPDERGWWGFSFRDVPERESGETRLLTLEEARVLSARDPKGGGGYHSAILAGDGLSLDLREIRHRPLHAAAARARPARRLASGTWIAERVYHNHSHWLTAHLPKIALLRALGRLEGLMLPAERGATIDASLRLLGVDPGACLEVAVGETVLVGRLTVLETDRFRPELLRLARDALARPAAAPRRRVWISRRSARGRKLLEEAALAPLLAEHGFETVEMEALGFEEQLALMGETAVLAAPHGAGLTNMMFCPEGAQIVEIADPAYPNPNFYALAAAMGHDYWWVRARGVGCAHPLHQDLSVEPEALRAVLEALPA